MAPYTCPVCDYPALLAPPRDYMICPQCGTEFGADDFTVSHAELRAAWIAAGRPFWRDSASGARSAGERG